MTDPANSSAEKQNFKFAAKWNRFMKEYEGVTANENTKQSKPSLVLSVIGDSITVVPKQWPKNVFQTALIEAAKSNEASWILYRDSTDGISKVVEEAYQHYEAMEFGTEAQAVSDKARRIKLIPTNYNEEETMSTDANKASENGDDTSLLDIVTFGSEQKILYFGPDLEYEIPVPTVVIVCQGDIQTISNISKALRNQLPVIIMKGSGKAADLVLDYLDNCGQCVIHKKYNLLFGAKFEEMNEHLEYIEKNRTLVWEFDLNKDDPLMLSSIVGEAVISTWSIKNILQFDLENPHKKTKLFEGLNWGTRSYVMNPKFSTSTSLPLYFYLGYQVLQENEEFMKEYGKVLLLEALKANRCEYVSSLMDRGVKIDSRDLNELYRKQSKGEEILVKLLLKKKCAGGTVHGICKCEKQEIYFVEAVKQACRDFLRYEELDSKDIGSDVSIGDILLWAIIFNRTELAEICWLREKDHILTGLVCSAILKKLSKKAGVIEERVLAISLEEHSTVFEQRCTSIMDKMNDENPDETIGLLTSNSSVWGIRSSPLTFAYENLMYDVVAHTCLKKYMRKKLYNNLATDIKSFFKLSINNFGSFTSALMTRHICNFVSKIT